jgi:phospholipid/cholesterol/gamma-HCH transport system substrate-binding protein
MEPDAKYTLIGAAVLILAALLAAAVVWLHGSGEGARAHRYKIYFDHQSLEGLELRGDVTMRGVRIGSVTGLRFSSQRPGSVEVLVALDPATPVRQSTRASVDRHLLTGLATLRLTNATEESPLLVEAPPDEPHPVIAEGESSMQQVTDTLSRLAESADESMKRLNSTLSPENRAAFAETLDNLRRASRHADASLERFDAAARSVGQAADEVHGMAASVTQAADEVHGMAASVTVDARKLTARYDELGAQATTAVREVREAARKMSGDEELRASARALRSAADSVGSAADRLRDPRQAIYGPAKDALGPGERAP